MKRPVHANVLAALFGLAISTAGAQVLNTGGGAPSNPPGTATPPPAGGGNGGNGGGSTSLFGNELPMFNPENDTVAFNGQTFNVMDNRLFEARFEKYLSLPAADSAEDLAYRQVLDQMLAALSPHNPGGPNFAKAVALLPVASQSKIDARLSDSLANAIYACIQSRRHVVGMNQMMRSIDKEQRDLALNAEQAATPTAFEQDKEKQGKETPEEVLAKWGRMSIYTKKMALAEAKQKELALEVAVAELRNKVEFQALIIQFFMQRRFEHVVISCRMYRQLFRDGDSSLSIEEGSDVNEMFSSSLGVNPTINTLDAFANEAMRDVDEGVDSFLLLAERGDIESASKRLAESFMVGEYLPKVRTVPLEEKQKVVHFVRNGNHLKAALEVRDFTTAERLLTEMKTLAKDFEYAKPQGMINAARQVSSLHLDKARVAAVNGDGETFGEEMRKATEIWPTNPRLDELSKMVTSAGDRMSQAKLDFDRLVAQKNYREIFSDQGRFAAAVGDDPQRRTQLESIVKEMFAVQMSLKAVEGLAQDGYHYNAWETLRETAEKYPTDISVSQQLNKVTVAVPDFVKAIETAENLEERGQYGSSLSLFLRAKKLHPGSRYAKEGIRRVLDELEPGGSSSASSRNEDRPADEFADPLGAGASADAGTGSDRAPRKDPFAID